MTFVTALIIFIVGGCFGFLAKYFLSNASDDQVALKERVNKSDAALVQYKLDVAEHLDSSAKLLEQMNNTCKIAMVQMKESTQLLQQATVAEKISMPFFSEETEDQLAKTAILRHKIRTPGTAQNVTEAPLDYSGNPSGLFADQPRTQTATAE